MVRMSLDKKNTQLWDGMAGSDAGGFVAIPKQKKLPFGRGVALFLCHLYVTRID
jgi:hypothetical protein